jgi:acetolactate synthase regulatory subunit
LYGPYNAPHQIVDQRTIEDYGICERQSYDVVAFQSQAMLESQTAAVVLFVDARPGIILVEQIAHIDDCRKKETPCYASIS